ncbi:hypothetical protein PGB28_00045 [Primorskyibacter aestuariivivens]|uniref:hypothetical protein n=1 Tax=Primorskyibacter aestuariivivens TaxID=1888912 RepID=UPI002301A009|nr:hypothetical protein [Primorskyibacter aestuariivivens]MDA7426828.1 hypothetical protein [Primorskyibacter aestuariivivens]
MKVFDLYSVNFWGVMGALPILLGLFAVVGLVPLFEGAVPMTTSSIRGVMT